MLQATRLPLHEQALARRRAEDVGEELRSLLGERFDSMAACWQQVAAVEPTAADLPAVFDASYNEGRRGFLESLAAYLRSRADAGQLSLAETAVPVERAGLDGQRLSFDDASFDSALSTWTLCTIPDPVAALRELRRVLRPGGRLFFVEHGAAPDVGVLCWQRRWDPVQRRVFAGCHVSRPIEELLAEAGLPGEDVRRYYGDGEPRLFGSLYEGRTAPVA